jgi:hypothetical protein|tara:strand:- start:631 stop:789 length:159 start_codon:yes stop_codon:yes gene_type:complete
MYSVNNSKELTKEELDSLKKDNGLINLFHKKVIKETKKQPKKSLFRIPNRIG